MEEAVIVSAARTPIGRFGGGFVDMPAADLGALAIKVALDRAKVSPASVEEVVFGCCLHVGEDTNIGRRASVKAGLPVEVPAFTVNRVCGSGLEAINTAARFIETGDAQVMVAGGTENMSQMPYVIRKARWGYRMGDGVIEDTMTTGPLHCPFNHYHMGVTAENVAARFEISRQAQDEFSLQSHQKAVAAIKAGRFKDEIIPVSVPQGRGQPKIVDTDEHPRADSSLERLGGLPAAFKQGGCVTAGNSSGVNDGAAAVVIMSRSMAKKLGLKPLLVVKARA
ncbi:MAG: acetyl-CoA C-acyltransferase, partial [Chloroflexota bacterium]|nr:acetyl-CoA C-acyltransferase [Chloroflexota bacterium]